MKSAVISDLHLGCRGGRDLLGSAENRSLLFEEIAEAERLVLLGDTVELFEGPMPSALEAARPFFEDLGEVMGGRAVVLVPGNHDHRLAASFLRSRPKGSPLELEQLGDPSDHATELIASWLGGATLTLAYPGIWLRPDVYATHGHHMDCHRRALRAECIAAAASMRLYGGLPTAPSVGDYERILGALYGFGYRSAQLRRREAGAGPGSRSRSGRAPRPAPKTVGVLNRLLGSSFSADRSWRSISELGIDASLELVRRLEICADHVIVGHTHRAGPNPGERDWQLRSDGPRLHNTGSWYRGRAVESVDPDGVLFRPGTVTWVGDEGAPERVRLEVKGTN